MWLMDCAYLSGRRSPHFPCPRHNQQSQKTQVNSDDSSDIEDSDSESNCSCSDSYGDSDSDDEAPGFEGLE